MVDARPDEDAAEQQVAKGARSVHATPPGPEGPIGARGARAADRAQEARRASASGASMTSSVTTSKRASLRAAEAGRERHVGGVAAGRHQDAADPRRVVAGVEGVPAAAEVDLEPGAEVHRVGLRRDADVAEVAGAVAGRDVQAAAERRRARCVKSRQTPIRPRARRRPCGSAGAPGSRTGRAGGRSRRRPAPAPSRAATGRRAPRRRPSAGRPRSSGCRAGRRAPRPAAPRPGAARASGATSSGRPLSAITKRVEIVVVPAGATMRVQRLPKPSM